METLISITLWNVVILAALLGLQPGVRVMRFNVQYALSNLDERVDEGVFARRLEMVCSNQLEALTLWVPVVVIAATFSPAFTHPHLSVIAMAFLFARLAYVAVSLAGIPVLRSTTWLVGFVVWAYLTMIVMGAIGS